MIYLVIVLKLLIYLKKISYLLSDETERNFNCSWFLSALPFSIKKKPQINTCGCFFQIQITDIIYLILFSIVNSNIFTFVYVFVYQTSSCLLCD